MPPKKKSNKSKPKNITKKKSNKSKPKKKSNKSKPKKKPDKNEKTEINQIDKNEIKKNFQIISNFTYDRHDDENYINPIHKKIKLLKKEDRLTSEYMTIFEYTEIVGHRAKHIENGGDIFTNSDDLFDPIEIAKREINERKCPLSIRRMHNNDLCEIWEVNEMIIPKL